MPNKIQTTYNNLTSYLKEFLSQKAKLDSRSLSAFETAWERESKEDVTDILKQVGKVSTSQKKDPNAPKRGKSNYIFFCNEVRGKMAKKYPNLKVTELSAKMGQKWKSMSEKEKEPYNLLSSKDKERYKEELKNYTPSPSFEKTKKGRKSKTGEPKPKRHLSAYMFFCKDKRGQVTSEYPDMKNTEVIRTLATLWKDLPLEERKFFNDKAKQDKERYLRECKSMLSSTPSEKPSKSHTDSVPLDSDDSEENNEEDASSGQEVELQPSPPPSQEKENSLGFILFAKQTREPMEKKHPGWSKSKVTKELKKLWKSLPEKKKASFSSRTKVIRKKQASK